MSIVYLVHFERSFYHARHYIGFCEEGNLIDRFIRHQRGDGSRLLRALNKAGIGYEVVRTWEGNDVDRDFERKLKRQRNGPRFCPTCRGEKTA